MKKVAIIFAAPSPYRIDLFNYLIEKYKQDFEFTILFATRPKDFGRQWTINENELVNTIFLKSKKISINIGGFKKNTNIPRKVFKILNEINPDIIIGSEYSPSIIEAFLWCKKNNKKYISWSDGTLRTERNINFIQKSFRKIICTKSDCFIASSTKTKEAQIRYGAKEDKIFISYLTVDIDKYLMKEEYKARKSENLLFVGRLLKLKGIDLLLKSLSLIDENYHFYIVGDGEEKENLIQLASELNIAYKVSFVGYLEGNDLLEYYKKCGVFIFPSLDDCFGLVLLEAMCANMVLIGSKYSGATYDVISNDINGKVIDPYNIKESAEIIGEVLHSKDEYSTLKENSQINLKKFEFENVSKGIINAMECVIKENN